ncbi:MAG: hypothetical protein AW10_01359 [Candidatus Accumulibacter appositus]|uniref:Uncharacterized protein n=1 Tax=Candidatus Accumulibacter appositus TaxID=1454003 RepID=A0A011QQI7_9PROT|nr:hypothetical protein [Accumulibacter sp.]EXI81159.1 MAG: hypothetical protein AW10_01359 [Candidatus Accumulibacter appositus]HRF04598.1 hypothetical protein [Accumulibacter sp.]
MRNDSRPNPHHTAAVPSLGVADRRSVPDRRVCSDRRHNADRRKPADSEALLAELEKRVAAAIRQQGSNIEGNGSGWDKLIIPFT